MQLGHADALADKALTADALELAHGHPEIGDDSGLRDGRRRPGRTSSNVGHCSCHVNYHIHANVRVKADYPQVEEESMRFALMIEPQQGMSYGDQIAVAKRAEANGFEALFRSDHYTSFPGEPGRPTTDAW